MSTVTDFNLNVRMNGLGAISVLVLALSFIASLFLPLDAPAANQEAAAVWLNTVAGLYLLGWLNQIIAMLACSGVFTAAGWLIFPQAPLRASMVWVLTIISVAVFLITKFFTLWSVPLAAKALASGSAQSDLARAFLSVLAPQAAFSLSPSLDYLGFWLYAFIGLCLFRPLFRLSISAKFAALAFLIFGIGLNLAYIAPLIDGISLNGISDVVLSLGILIFIASACLFFDFRAQREDRALSQSA